MDNIKFGTDGWRGVIAEDFTFTNVRRVAAAIARVCRQGGRTPQRPRGWLRHAFCLGGGGCRGGGSAGLARGFPSGWRTPGTPTPAVSYAVVARETAGAVMVTASHNPARWNGIKFKASYGGSADPAIMKRIEGHLHRLDHARTSPRKVKPAAIEVVDLTTPYLERLKQLVSLDQHSRLRPAVRD